MPDPTPPSRKGSSAGLSARIRGFFASHRLFARADMNSSNQAETPESKALEEAPLGLPKMQTSHPSTPSAAPESPEDTVQMAELRSRADEIQKAARSLISSIETHVKDPLKGHPDKQAKAEKFQWTLVEAMTMISTADDKWGRYALEEKLEYVKEFEWVPFAAAGVAELGFVAAIRKWRGAEFLDAEALLKET